MVFKFPAIRRMDRPKRERRRQRRRPELERSKTCAATLCCGCRLSVSSSEDIESSGSKRVEPLSSLPHAVVLERLEQMVRGKERGSTHWRKRKEKVSESSKYIIMIAMDKYSEDPIEDFRQSIWEVIVSNRIEEAKELRSLLNCYISMNSVECRPFILEAFHGVCNQLFMSSNW